MDKPSGSTVQTAGRGALYITAAKLWFLVTGWALIFGLPRVFKLSADGDAERGQALFGAYKLVFMGVSFLNNGIITGTIQAVSKFTSEDEATAGAVKRAALQVQGGIGLALALLYVAFAGVIAGLLGSPELAGMMRLSAGVIVAYSCYAVFIGSFNGLKRFDRQAAFDVSYSTIKTLLIFGLVLAGLEVLGAVLGFLAASVLIAVAAALVAGVRGPGRFPARRFLDFGVLLVVYTFLLNLVMSLDLFLLKALASRAALAAGLDAATSSELGKTLAGQYGAMQGLAFIPYQAILSIAFVAFPMISKVTHLADGETTRRYVGKTMRFAAVFTAGLASVFVALPRQALGLVFPPEYETAALALRILSLGIAMFGLLVVSNTILNGAGMVRAALAVIGVTLVALIGAVVALVLVAPVGPDTLVAAATGSTVGMTVGLVISGLVVRRRLGAFLPLATALRVALAFVAVVGLGAVLPRAGKLVSLAECALVLVAYFLVLVLVREFGREDLEQLREVVRRRRK